MTFLNFCVLYIDLSDSKHVTKVLLCIPGSFQLLKPSLVYSLAGYIQCIYILSHVHYNSHNNNNNNNYNSNNNDYDYDDDTTTTRNKL